MTTQIIEAQNGRITPEMFAVAEKEGFSKQEILLYLKMELKQKVPKKAQECSVL